MVVGRAIQNHHHDNDHHNHHHHHHHHHYYVHHPIPSNTMLTMLMLAVLYIICILPAMAVSWNMFKPVTFLVCTMTMTRAPQSGYLGYPR